jgi:hypothetical protein
VQLDPRTILDPFLHVTPGSIGRDDVRGVRGVRSDDACCGRLVAGWSPRSNPDL